MAVFTMPKLGLTMTEGTIRRWLVADGASVQVGEPVLVIETDKVETEVEARDTGVLSITGQVGETYECGHVIGYVGGDIETSGIVANQDRGPSSAGLPAARGEGGRTLASPMARAAARHAAVELHTIAGSGPGGRIIAADVAAHVEARATQDTGESTAVEPNSGESRSGERHALAPEFHEPHPNDGRASLASTDAVPASSRLPATPGARMLADLLGIDLALVAPTAPDARITRDDVAAWARAQLRTAAEADLQPPVPTQPAPEQPLLQQPTDVVPLQGMRGRIAERMHESLHAMAQLTLSVEADMGPVNAERNRLRQMDEPVPGYTAWVVAAAARALREHGYVNSQVIADGVAHLPEIHIGVAVALDDGLIVPVIRNADQHSVAELHHTIADQAARARSHELTLPEVEGATFSVTALGMFGVDMFTPVVNPPNTAILGVGRLRSSTRWDDGVPSPQTVMTLSFTWDHRAFDGAPAAEFAQTVVRLLADPTDLSR